MSVKRLLAIGFIYACTFIAWMFLGWVNSNRTKDTETALTSAVHDLFGGTHVTHHPSAYFLERAEGGFKKVKRETITESYPTKSIKSSLSRRGQSEAFATEVVEETYADYRKVFFDMEKSTVIVTLSKDYRKKGVLWFPTYWCDVTADYVFANPLDEKATFYFVCPYDTENAIARDIMLVINGETIEDVRNLFDAKGISVTLAKGERAEVRLTYRSSGTKKWFYRFGTGNENRLALLKNFRLTLTTDFKNVDYDATAISPDTYKEKGEGKELVWALNNTLAKKDVGLIIPNRVNPGYIAAKATFFGGVPLLFYFFILILVMIREKVNIHPMNFFFLAAAFFSFHLILSYFSNHINIYLAFAIGAVVSMVLVSSYLKIFLPWKIAFIYSPIAQGIYLIAFSYTFFFKGVTGMIVTIVSVITLFILMQATGSTDWNEVFRPTSDTKGVSS